MNKSEKHDKWVIRKYEEDHIYKNTALAHKTAVRPDWRGLKNGNYGRTNPA